MQIQIVFRYTYNVIWFLNQNTAFIPQDSPLCLLLTVHLQHICMNSFQKTQLQAVLSYMQTVMRLETILPFLVDDAWTKGLRWSFAGRGNWFKGKVCVCAGILSEYEITSNRTEDGCGTFKETPALRNQIHQYTRGTNKLPNPSSKLNVEPFNNGLKSHPHLDFFWRGRFQIHLTMTWRKIK